MATACALAAALAGGGRNSSTLTGSEICLAAGKRRRFVGGESEMLTESELCLDTTIKIFLCFRIRPLGLSGVLAPMHGTKIANLKKCIIVPICIIKKKQKNRFI